MKRSSKEYIIENLNRLYPDAHCELNHKDSFELLIAVVLSAQTTDVSVNRVTPALFEKYPDAISLSEASEEDVMRLIHSIGLYKNKSRNIINLAKELVKRFDGEVPSKREELESLPGVGRKTANVVLSNCFDYPAFAVDTHVSRVSKRLMIARKDDDVLTIEKKLMKFFPRNCWSRLHHQFIFFGRYKCKAKNPECTDCPFRDSCRKD
ncbi:MAG: endonuclease III [Solobacterium sp.]|nr:endonuclease III [Solobacterium sp.]MDD6834869.1 endonuclease III [Solobacterium sp.]MDD6954998.1 endonuclease III [Solobacterium sp.]MDY4640916.1 endonuclease III [Erysipelotrichaceae bacterium]